MHCWLTVSDEPNRWLVHWQQLPLRFSWHFKLILMQMSWGSRSNNGPQWNMSWWKVCKMKRNKLKDQGLSWIFVKKLLLIKTTHAPLVENTWICHILLQLHEYFSEVLFSKKYEILLVQIRHVMSYLSFYFSLFTIEPCAVF